MSGYIVYGGGIGDGSGHTGGVCVGTNCIFEQTIAATNNTLNIKNGATVWIAVGGEGKGARDNTVNITNSTVSGAVLGGNGTWFGQPRDSGDAIHNIVNISGSSKVLFQNYGGFNNTSVAGGRATGNHRADDNEVNISGTPAITGRITGALVDKGGAKANKVKVTGEVTFNGDVNGVIVSSTDSTATLSENTVTINHAKAKTQGSGGVFGVNGNNGNPSNPASKTTAENNGVILQNGTIEGDGGIAGSYMVTKSKGNYSNISGGRVKTYAYGGYSRADGYSSENDHVTMSGGTVDGGVYGNYNTKGNIKNGYVTLSGGEVKGEVYGGWSVEGEVEASHVDISGNVKVGKSVVGGRSDKKTVKNSYVASTGGEIGDFVIGSWGDAGSIGGKVTST
ncbi:MAG: hypothetical protein HXK63_07585, partial [Campylobacter sp.]|nr:hypothetical protein [Campylobacter sp.]